MADQRKKWLRLASFAGLVLVMFFSLTQSSQAQGIIYGDNVPKGVTLNNDVILFGDNVVVNGDVKGDILALGRTVTISGTVDGSAIVLGEIVNLNDEVKGSLYNASVQTDMGPRSKVGRNLYYAGVSLNAQPDSSIGRDLYAFTVGAQLTKNVGRDVVAVIGPFEIFKVIYEALNSRFTLPKINIPFLGLSPANEPMGSLGAAAALPVRLVGLAGYSPQTLGSVPAQTSGVDWQTLGDWALGRAREFIVLLLIGGLLLWLVPSRLEAWVKRSAQKPWLLMLYGLAYIIIAFVGAAILLFMILAVSIGIAFLSLTNLAFLLAMLGMMGVGLAFFVFYLFAFYVSKVVVADLLGRLILSKLAPNAVVHRFWTFLLGLFLYVLLVSIPYLGLVLAFLAVLLGFGAVVQAVMAERRMLEAPAVVVAPSEAVADVEI